MSYRRYVLLVMTAVYAVAGLDRSLIILLVEPIKHDLGLSDTEIGLLTGIAFGLFYAIAGVPIARWADRGNRPLITAIAMMIWGVTMALCLFIVNFPQMLLSRMAAAVGEAGSKPPTYSLLGDYFPEPAERTRALGIYMTAPPLAALISFALGGWLNDLYGWRAALAISAIPGFLLALVVKTTIRETRPPRKRGTSLRPAPPFGDVLRILFAQPSFRHLTLGLILIYTLSLGLSPWYAAFMIRTHNMDTSQLGLWFGLIFGVGGIAGVLFGGYVTGRIFSRDERAQMRSTALTVAALVPCFVAFLTISSAHYALLSLVPLILAFNFFLAPTYSLMQRLVADDMRATMMSVVMLLANLIGMGIGPLLVGAASDLVRPYAGPDSLRYAMLLFSLLAAWAAFHFWKVSQTVREDLARVGSGGMGTPSHRSPLEDQEC